MFPAKIGFKIVPKAIFTVALGLFLNIVSPAKADDLKISVNYGPDTNFCTITDAIYSDRFSYLFRATNQTTNQTTNQPSRAPILGCLPMTLAVKAGVTLAMSNLPFDLSVSAAIRWSRLSMIFPRGIGIFVNEITLESHAVGLDLRGGALFGKPQGRRTIEMGLGIESIRAVDRFNYGRWRIVEQRQHDHPFVYVRYVHGLHKDLSAYLDAQHNRYGPNLAIGLELKL